MDLCEYNCTNTVGSYACSCDIGFQLNEDGLHCDGQTKLSLISILATNKFLLSDIDECYERIDECEHECVNTNGSYTCACRIGYRLLTSDGYSCTGKWPWFPIMESTFEFINSQF